MKGNGQNNNQSKNDKNKLLLLIITLCLVFLGGCLTYKYFSEESTMSLNDEYEILASYEKVYEINWKQNINFKATGFKDETWTISHVINNDQQVEDTTIKTSEFSYTLYGGLYHITLNDNKNTISTFIKINSTPEYESYLKDNIAELIQEYGSAPSSIKGKRAGKALERIFSTGKVIRLKQSNGNLIELSIKGLLEKVIDGDNYSTLTTPTIDDYGKVTDIVIGKGVVDKNTPIVAFSIPSKGYFNENIQFSNKSINVKSFDWDFGDGTKSTKENPKHEYSSNGKEQQKFIVKLTAIGNNGKKDYFSSEIIISKRDEGKNEPQPSIVDEGKNEPQPSIVDEGENEPQPPIVDEGKNEPLLCPECPKAPQIKGTAVGSKINTGEWKADQEKFSTPGKKTLNLTYKHQQIDSRCKNTTCKQTVSILVHVDKGLFEKALKNDINSYDIKNVIELIDKATFNFSSKTGGMYTKQSYQDLVDAIEAGIDGWENGILLEDFKYSDKTGRVTHFKIIKN